MIPKIIHYCWYGKKPLPKKSEEYILGWQRILKDYRFIFWGDKDIPDTPWTRNAYSHGYFGNVSNYTRWFHLYEYGGVYMDIDIQLVKDFGPLLEHSFFAGWQPDPVEVNTAVIGCEPKHPLCDVITRCYPLIYSGTEDCADSAPTFFTQTLKYLRFPLRAGETTNRGGDYILSTEHFYPCPYWKAFSASCITPNTYAVHHWMGSWKG